MKTLKLRTLTAGAFALLIAGTAAATWPPGNGYVAPTDDQLITAAQTAANLKAVHDELMSEIGQLENTLDDRINTLELANSGDRLETLESEMLPARVLALEEGASKFQVKHLTEDYQSTSADLGDLTFANLDTQSVYSVSCMFLGDTANDRFKVRARSAAGNQGTEYARVAWQNHDTAGQTEESRAMVFTFSPVTSLLYFWFEKDGANARVQGDGSSSETFCSLIEHDALKPTTAH